MAIGIITGSGTYALPGFEDAEAGARRDALGRDGGHARAGSAGIEVAHVSRHGAGHVRLSNHVAHRANLGALAQLGVDGVLAVTVCGAVDPSVELGSLICFDDLHFPSNRLPDGALCTFYGEAGDPLRGHWIYEDPFSPALRGALLAAADAAGVAMRDGGCYGHVDGPRFNTKAEIRGLAVAGVTAVSQTAGPETVLAGEAELPFALVGYATDYANGVQAEATAGRAAARADRGQHRHVRAAAGGGAAPDRPRGARAVRRRVPLPRGVNALVVARRAAGRAGGAGRGGARGAAWRGRSPSRAAAAERVEVAAAAAAALGLGPGPLLVLPAICPRLGRAHVAAALADLDGGLRRRLRPDARGRLVPRRARAAAGRSCSTGNPFTVAREHGAEVGLLRHERALRTAADAAAFLADPLTPADVRAALSARLTTDRGPHLAGDPQVRVAEAADAGREVVRAARAAGAR